jgi:Fe-S cluster biogenesis protein NfuA
MDERDDHASKDEHNQSHDGGSGTVRQRVEHVLNLIRPAVQSDGGDLELVDVTDDGVVSVRFHGACVGCPSSTLTLQAGIEKNLKDHVPEVTAVEAVN